jgi:hypothetical protein
MLAQEGCSPWHGGYKPPPQCSGKRGTPQCSLKLKLIEHYENMSYYELCAYDQGASQEKISIYDTNATLCVANATKVDDFQRHAENFVAVNYPRHPARALPGKRERRECREVWEVVLSKQL